MSILKGKKEWIEIHWDQSNEFYHCKVGEQPHSDKFRDLGWKWTPKICLCHIPCFLDTSNETMLGKT
jgi:hypothetical protein